MDLKWENDWDVLNCFLCHSVFNFFNRRHHCRKCGKVVCGNCSKQTIKYFPRTMIVDNGYVTRSSPYESYRTCDTCVDEINMIRRALNNDDSGSLISNNSVTKYSTRMTTRTISSSHSSLSNDNVSDDNLCPICAKNLRDVYKSKDDFELFKESHINECLTSYDFSLNHQRYEGNHPKNKMLVYNIPPIPEPKFESIVGSVDTIKLDSPDLYRVGEGSKPETVQKFEETIGSLNSNNTTQTIKQFDECVVCLEDLKPGDKVGRLECLCVFHYKCIKDWFNKKGYGECPVHYLQK